MDTIIVDAAYLMNSNGSYVCLYNPSTGMFRVGWDPPFFGEEADHGYFFEDVDSDEIVETWSEYLVKTNNFSHEEAFERAKNRLFFFIKHK